MRKAIIYLMAGWAMLAISSTAFAYANYIGYSGAPGTSGRCAASCHGTSGGTIQVAGWPNQYAPGQVCTLAVSRASGSSIRQFNASVRFGTGSQNAGLIAAATRTAVYNTAGETNGVHLSSSNQTTCTFLWTAPQTGADTVKLYLTGLQGNAGGQNTNLVLVSTRQTTDMENESFMPNKYTLLTCYPNPFNAQTSIKFTMPSANHVKIEIYNVLGQKVETLVDGFMGAGEHTVNWNASSEPSGVYFCRMATDSDRLMRRITLLK
jgi:hypothetical protein